MAGSAPAVQDAAVINTGGGGGGGGGLLSNWRVLAIGGGAVLALVVFVVQRGKSGGDGTAAGEAGALGTSANIALGQIAYDQTRISGEEAARDYELADQDSKRDDAILLALGSLGTDWAASQSELAASVQSGFAGLQESNAELASDQAEIGARLQGQINSLAGSTTGQSVTISRQVISLMELLLNVPQGTYGYAAPAPAPITANVEAP